MTTKVQLADWLARTIIDAIRRDLPQKEVSTDEAEWGNFEVEYDDTLSWNGEFNTEKFIDWTELEATIEDTLDGLNIYSEQSKYKDMWDKLINTIKEMEKDNE